MIDPAKITTIIIFESKKYVSCSKHRNKKRSGKFYVLIKKKTYQIKKHIAQMDFAEYHRKSEEYQRTAKFIMAGFCEMDFMKQVRNLGEGEGGRPSLPLF